MKEIRDIIKSYWKAQKDGLKTALATVVKVEGSSYRQPGARMLVTEEGQLTGAISGGCLEGDALRKALLAIHQRNKKLITYDTSNPDDVEFGVQLGCNGIVHILFEYIDETSSENPIYILEQSIEKRNESVIVTLFSVENRNLQEGTIAFFSAHKTLRATKSMTEVQMIDLTSVAIKQKQSILSRTGDSEVLLQYIPPQTTLVIAGAGNDAKPLAEIANLLGWKTIVADGRATHAVAGRFPTADQVLLGAPEEIVEQIDIDTETVFVLMTHNYNYDLALLKLIIQHPVRYIGTLGPKTKLKRMLDELQKAGLQLTENELNKIYGPVGMDIGAETSEEIALSAAAEIKAVLSGRNGLSLRDKQDKIHTDIISL